MEIIRIRRQNDDRGHSFGMEERDNHSLDNDCVEPVADLKLIRKKNESYANTDEWKAKDRTY